MRRRRNITVLVFATVFMVSSRNANADYTFGIPITLGPKVNSSAHDDTPSVTGDGLELYFMSYRLHGQPDGDLYVSKRITTQDPWGEAVNLGPTVNTLVYDVYPCISSDGLELYFVSDRPGTPDGGGIWVTKRADRNSDWGPPVPLGPFLDEGYVADPAFSADGLQLYFSDGGTDQSDLWRVSRPSVSEPWGQAVKLGPTVNSDANDACPSISSDGRMLFFYSDRSGGLGDRDIWVARRAQPGDAWGVPEHLGPDVSTDGYEIGPCISADGRTLYFQSGEDRHMWNQEIWQVSVDPVVDLNGDGAVNITDMCIMLGHWGTDERLCDIGPMPWGDGIVDFRDFVVFAEYWLTGPADNVIERRVSAGTDDAEEALNPGFNNWNQSSDLELGYDRPDNGGEQLVGMTFRDIDIAPGEPISRAYVEFACDELIGGTDPVHLLIWGHLTPDSEGFVEPFVISNRPRTETKLSWQPDPWDAGGQKIQTVNIAPIIQELVDQEGWIAGNAVEIIIGPDPDKPEFWGVRCAQSYDRSALAAPLLHIELGPPCPVAHWKLDETEGDIAHDSAGDYDGTLHGDLLWQPAGGNIDGALEFDGAGDYVSTYFVLNPANGPFSVFAWIKGDSPGGTVMSQTDSDGGYGGATWLGADPSDGTLFTSLCWFELKAEYVVTDGQWHRVGIVWDGARRHLYVDGAEVAGDAEDKPMLSSKGDLHIGANKSLDPGSFFSGLIDDVRIYDLAIEP